MPESHSPRSVNHNVKLRISFWLQYFSITRGQKEHADLVRIKQIPHNFQLGKVDSARADFLHARA